ncbi:hypothetical protein PAAG_12454 [Paracoccidioides lutzii Pb01]|uniref:Uncharacterized protein n=1 Tax=Paracoccidioides lutzii (strain ATCC MYA-826 / Pb01) TaxID=502779 RepID=A0A0A2UZ62_PARBA|nr:hypothetical protein PAAG_12454 [Paracoccidioides lutzii Pb01]KGQ00866.1 hypothetical protein PAAG_12454 [Paracoccidioides lutzii Pb01]
MTEAQVRSQRAIVHQQHPHPVPRNGGEASGLCRLVDASLMVLAPFLSAFGYQGTLGVHVGIASGAITELDAPYEMAMMLRRMTPAWTN